MLDSTAPVSSAFQALSQQFLNFPNLASREFAFSKIKQFYIAAQSLVMSEDVQKKFSAYQLCTLHTACVDEIIKRLFEFAFYFAFPDRKEVAQLKNQFSCVAIAEYGRQESTRLGNHSIHLIASQDVSVSDAQLFRESLHHALLFLLWKTRLHITIFSNATPDLIAQAQGNLLLKCRLRDARLICGSQPLFDVFTSVFRHCCLKNPNLEDFITLRQKHHNRYYDHTTLIAEPNIQCNIGGIFDLRMLDSLSHLHQDKSPFETPQDHSLLSHQDCIWLTEQREFIFRIRHRLQQLTQCNTLKLTHEHKPTVAESFQQSEDVFMSDYYKRANTFNFLWDDVTYKIMTTSAQKHKWWLTFTKHSSTDDFMIENGYITPESSHVFRENPARLIQIFKYHQRLNLRFNPETRHLIRDSAHLIQEQHLNDFDINECLLSIFTQPGRVAPTLQKMYTCGALNQFFHKAISHSFYSLTCPSSKFANGAHIMNSIKVLDGFFQADKTENLPYYEILSKTQNAELIYLTLFLHDIASPGKRSKYVLSTLERFSLNKYQKQVILFVIEHAKNFVNQARNFDPEHPSSKMESAENAIPNVHCLNLLYLHNVCNLKASTTSEWNTHKKILLRNFYQSCFDSLKHASQPLINLKKHRSEIQQHIERKMVQSPAFPEISKHFEACSHDYFQYYTNPVIQRHIEMVHQLKQDTQQTCFPPAPKFRYDSNQACMVLDVIVNNQVGLLFRIAAALSKVQFQITKVDMYARSDEIYIITFSLEHPAIGSDIEKYYEQFMPAFNECMLIDPKDPIEFKPHKNYPVIPQNKQLIEPTINFYHNLTDNLVTIELRGYDQFGLFCRACRAIFLKNFSITGVSITANCNIINDTYQITKETIKTPELLSLREELYELISQKS